MLTLSKDWHLFYDEIIFRAKELIKIGHWDDVLEEDLILWLENFKTNEEKLFSVLLVYRIIYRSEKALLSMYQHIIDISLPNILEEYGLYSIASLREFHKDLELNPHKLPFRFSTIDDVDRDPAKSGAQLLRIFDRKGSFHKKIKVSTSCLKDINPKNIKAIILFDDISASGEQFITYLDNTREYHDKFKFIYCPLVAHEDALKSIQAAYPNIIVKPVETMDNSNSFFHSNAFPRSIIENISMDELKDFYIQLMTTRTKLKEEQIFGWGKQSLSYFFNISAPNNNLQIFTYKDENWHNLFNR